MLDLNAWPCWWSLKSKEATEFAQPRYGRRGCPAKLLQGFGSCKMNGRSAIIRCTHPPRRTESHDGDLAMATRWVCTFLSGRWVHPIGWRPSTKQRKTNRSRPCYPRLLQNSNARPIFDRWLSPGWWYCSWCPAWNWSANAQHPLYHQM